MIGKLITFIYKKKKKGQMTGWCDPALPREIMSVVSLDLLANTYRLQV